MFAATPPRQDERDALIDLGYRLNLVRIAAASGALFAARRSKSAITPVTSGTRGEEPDRRRSR
jgi:hypothetical protein